MAVDRHELQLGVGAVKTLLISVSISEYDDQQLIVRDERYGHEEVVDLSPAPAWPSPLEQNDVIGQAVVRVLDAVHFDDTGEILERN